MNPFFSRWSLLKGQAALDAVALGGDLRRIEQTAILNVMDVQAEKVLAVWSKHLVAHEVVATAIEGARPHWTNVNGVTVQTLVDEPFWVTFFADPTTTMVFALLAQRSDVVPTNEQRHVNARAFALRWSFNGQPFASIRTISRTPETLGMFQDFCAAMTDGHVDLGGTVRPG